MEAQIQSTVWSLIIGAGLLLGARKDAKSNSFIVAIAAIIGTVLLAYSVASMLFGIIDFAAANPDIQEALRMIGL